MTVYLSGVMKKFRLEQMEPIQDQVVYVFPTENSKKLGRKTEGRFPSPSECPPGFFTADGIRMKTRIDFALMLSLVLAVVGATLTMAQQASTGGGVPPHRPQGSCDIYASAGDPCVAAHSTTRALYATYNGPLYQVLRRHLLLDQHHLRSVS